MVMMFYPRIGVVMAIFWQNNGGVKYMFKLCVDDDLDFVRDCVGDCVGYVLAKRRRWFGGSFVICRRCVGGVLVMCWRYFEDVQMMFWRCAVYVWRCVANVVSMSCRCFGDVLLMYW